MQDAVERSKGQFIRRWGEMGGYWGINRTTAELHALLYLSVEPMCTDDIMEALQISRGNTSMNIRELVNWGLARRIHKKGDRKGETGYRMIIKWDIQDEGAKSLVDRDKVTVTQSILLDLTEDGSGLDMGKGKNIGLGQIRTALSQNEAGAEWSPSMISGQPAKIQVKADVYQGRTTAQVVAVTTP